MATTKAISSNWKKILNNCSDTFENLIHNPYKVKWRIPKLILKAYMIAFDVLNYILPFKCLLKNTWSAENIYKKKSQVI